MPVTPLEEVFSQIRAARMAVMVAGEGDECEGDLVMAAEKVTPAARELYGALMRAGWFRSHCRKSGSANWVFRWCSRARATTRWSRRARWLKRGLASRLESRRMIAHARFGVLASAKSGPEDIVMPGHVLPLMALSGGVMLRMGRAEGAVDLVRSAGMRASAALCAILREDGESAQLTELREFADDSRIADVSYSAIWSSTG